MSASMVDTQLYLSAAALSSFFGNKKKIDKQFLKLNEKKKSSPLKQ